MALQNRGRFLRMVFSQHRSSCQRHLRLLNHEHNGRLNPQQIYLEQTRHKGHAHWEEVLRNKLKSAEKADAVNVDLLRKMKLATIAEGYNPELNKNLAYVLAYGRTLGIADSTMQAHLKKLSERTKRGEIKITLEATGPGSCKIIMECETANRSKNKMRCNSAFKKFGRIADGLAAHCFDHKGIILLHRGGEKDLTLEQVEDIAIECGVEEVEEYETLGQDTYRLICAGEDLYKVKKEMVKVHKIDVDSYSHEYIPNTWTVLEEDDLQKLKKLMDRLHDEEDIVKIYDNVLAKES